MNATPHLATIDRNDEFDALTATSDPTRAPESNRKRFVSGAVKGGVLVAALVADGILFWGVPSGDEALPDAEQMALLGDSRNSSAENVSFWAGRVDDVPTSAAFRSQLASSQLALAGDTGDLAGYGIAEQTALGAVQLSPNNETSLLVLAAARSGQHDFRGALELADQVLVADPTSVRALLSAGDAHLELGDYADARAAYQLVSTQVGGVAPVLSRFARLESLTGSIDEAHDYARRALLDAGDQDLRHADAAFYWFQLATFEFHLGNAAEAADLARTALSIDPKNLGSNELLAKALVAIGDHDGATALYEQLVDGGGAADLHGELAKLYERAGRDDEAAEQVALGLDFAARNADRFPAERRHLIGFLADHDPAEALRLAELDLSERQDIYSHAWYAWSLFQTGDAQAAAEAMQPALAYGTEDAMMLYQAGVIEAAVGDVEAARTHLSQSLELNPQFDLVHAARARTLLASISD